MGVEQTNRIIDPGRDRAREIRRLLDLREKRRIRGKVKQYISFRKKFKIKAAECAKCGHSMRKDIASVQKENRANIMKWHGACPICLACITGKKRKSYKTKDRKKKAWSNAWDDAKKDYKLEQQNNENKNN